MRHLAGRVTVAFASLLLVPALALSAAAPQAPAGSDGADASHIGGTLVLCGQVTEYTAPDGVATDGALTMTGVSIPDPHAFVVAATATITPADSALLTALAATDSFTCLDAVGDGMAVLIAVEIADSAELCGSVEPAGSTWRLSTTDFEEQTTTLSAEAEVILDDDNRLDDLLAWFDQFANEACLTFTTGANGVVSGISLDGQLLVCGEVADTSSFAYFAVFEWDVVSDRPLRPDIVGLGGIILPASLFTDAALGVLELGYAAQQYAELDGSASICAQVPVGGSELLPASFTNTEVHLCGSPTILEDTIGLTDLVPPAVLERYALFSDALLGYPSAPLFPSAPNLTQAWYVSDVLCVEATLMGGAGDESVAFTGTTDICVDVVARSGSAITLRSAEQELAFGFELTPGSSVDAALTPGTRSAVRIVAQRGLDGAVTVALLSATCTGTGAPGAGGLPDTAMRAAGKSRSGHE